MTPSENQPMKITEIPFEEWNMQSVGDTKSYLLQGARISTDFINSLLWFASLTNMTKYVRVNISSNYLGKVVWSTENMHYPKENNTKLVLSPFK